MKYSDGINKEPSEMTVPEYWELYREEIAKERGWVGYREEDERKGNAADHSATMVSYSRYMKLMAPYMKKPISEMMLSDIRFVLAQDFKRNNGTPYSQATKKIFSSILYDVFEFARNSGHSGNPMEITSFRRKGKLKPKDKKLKDFIDRITDVNTDPKRVKKHLKSMMSQYRHLPRSLTLAQQSSLIKTVQEYFLDEGRYVSVAIANYTGARPGEVRGLVWKNYVPFRDDETRHELHFADSRDSQGKSKGRMKTKNGYRHMPVTIELEKILTPWYERVRQLAAQKGISEEDLLECPICCYGIEIDRFCKDYELSEFAKELMDWLFDDAELYYGFIIDMMAEQVGLVQSEGITVLSYYILRRNFCSWICNATSLDDLQQCYVMGHDMTINGVDQRPFYNNETSVIKIMRAMDENIVSLRLGLYERCIRVPKEGVHEFDCGLLIAEFPLEELIEPISIWAEIETEEPDAEVNILIENNGKLVAQPRYEMIGKSIVAPPVLHNSVDTQFAHYCALKKVKAKRLEKRRKNSSSIAPT